MSKRLSLLEERVSILENKCVVRGCPESATQEHHVIPVIFSKLDRNAPFDPNTNPCLDVCDKHHDMIHEIEKDRKYKHAEAVKRGQQKAMANGVKFGRKTSVNENTRKIVKRLRKKGMPIKQIAKDLQIGVGTVYKNLEPQQLEIKL